ncbi:MAG: hypothetical protein O2826_02965 [Chloroflexi bacterium]|nr:hypothetical protein [Chloroflexota bacterium]
MAELETLDRTYHFVMSTFVRTGRSPHFTELAAELGVSGEQGRLLLHEFAESGLPAWLDPGTDILASLAPFSSLPTQYRITVEGEQKWFGQ